MSLKPIPTEDSMDPVIEPMSLQGNNYEVFLSYSKGEETQESFASCLCSTLREARISVFKDDISIEQLRSIIEGSKISIIIFSKQYASSRRCLEELTKIMEFRRAYDQVVLPIFYGVEPFEVRNQAYSFGKAFQGLILTILPTEDQMSSWRTAFSEAGAINGFVVPNVESKDERENVKAVVDKVCNILDKDLFVAKHPVGVNNRVQEVMTMLQSPQSEDVIMIGIWGMGGVGKTTIAKAIYNKIGREFESSSYLRSIREVWYQEEGQVRLQNQLLNEICMTTQMTIHSIESGKITLRDRLRHKKALVVLDDVDKSAQLKALVGRRDWFKSGSMIIITTRDQRLLHEMDCAVYRMKKLDEKESIELLSWHAFKQESPKEDFTELSRDIVAYSGGLPLALTVLGSYLFGREAQEWKSLLENLKKIPKALIQKKLKISFDGLDDLEKEIFLDISCFFIGMDRNDVTQILNGCGFFPGIGIKTLVEQSLLTIDEENRLGMHDLVRDMGREIVRQQSEKELGKRSRLWFHEDARSVLLECKGTKAIEGLKLSDTELRHFETKAFKKMKRLRLLHLDKVQLEGDYKYISGDLRWLCWHGFPEEHIPSKFCQEELVAIELEHSSLRQVWQEPLALKRLKILNLSHSHYLVVTPDFSKLPNLEKLILKNCPKLSMLHDSIGLLHKLLLLDLDNCIGLRSLPRSVYGLKCLKTLNLSRCVMIEKLEKDIEQMESLTTLTVPTTKHVPFSFERLKSHLCALFFDEHMLPSTSKVTSLSGSKHKREEEEEEEELPSITPRKAHRSSIDTEGLVGMSSQVDDVYSMELLNDDESDQLFSRTTFQQTSPEGEFINLCRRVVTYAEGLPLALEALVSIMHMLLEMAWMQLSTDLPPDIYHQLKLSFDSLDDDQKEIFLKLVLFYIGEDKNDVIQELNGAITVLVERSLITVDDDDKLRIHDLLQLMGRQIIRHQGPKYKYEVFLSFRGDDTRTTFISHLYAALCNASIVVFKDNFDLPRGSHIRTELLEAIGSSKIAVIIFSKKYAESKWCLEELSTIMEFRESNDLVVLPVFYDVYPSEIRHQTSSFGEAFKHLIQRTSPPYVEVRKWRTALIEAASIAGINVPGSRNESEEVKTILQNVCDILDKKDLFVAEHPVGVDNRVQEVMTMLQNHQTEDVFMVGLWGMGGLGKTTIARAIYNKIGHCFEGRCYLSNIREVWDQEEGQVRLQNQLLSEICRTTKAKINSIESEKISLRDRLHHKKALVVLDDVDKVAQLEALVGSRDWFKPGSIIIITTRDQRLLHLMDSCVYLMKNLDESESIELFSWHAFKQESPKEGFTELSRDMVAYTGGLPLALIVLGSYLFDRELDEWKSVLERLKKIPHVMIEKKLEISFDGLDDLEKEIFLDISCFFIGMDRNDVTQILNGCGFFADIGIKTLVERSLVTIDEKNKLGMHDLVRDMGREIVREQSEKELGRRSRLWFHEDAQAVLLKDMGTKAIEGLSLKLADGEQFETKAFKKMKRLRLLRLENVQLKGDFKYLSRDLKWLCWHGFPIKCMPTNFYQQELVAIELEYSSLTQVWKKPLFLERLKILNLGHSYYLVQTPDFSKLPNLEKLILKDCPSLSVIHHSIGLLHKLLLLDLEDCIGLLGLPRSIYTLKCLKTLILSGCKNVEKLEEDIEQMESLTTLIAPTVKQVPFSLVRLKSISYLSVCGHEGFSLHVIPSLYLSWISPTNNPLLWIPTHAGMPSSILLDMPNSIHDPSTIILSSIPKHQSLLLKEGLEIPDSLCSPNCTDISRLKNCLGHLLIQIGKNSQVFHALAEKISQGLNLTKYSDDCVLPGDHYPYWLVFKGEGASIKFNVPPIKGCDHLKGMAISYVYIPPGDLSMKTCESCINCLMIINYTKTTTLVYTEDKLKSLEEGEMKEIISNLEAEDQVEVKAVFWRGFTVKKIAVYLIYKETFDEQMEASTSEATNLSGTKHKCEEEEETH